MPPIKSCIFSPTEAQAIAVGDVAETAMLQYNICPSLPGKTSKNLQKQFQSVVAAAPKAVAFLWRGKKIETFQPGHMPTAKSCAKTATPLRCDAVVALGQGKLSHMTALEEEKMLGPATCDWRKAEEKQDEDWQHYFNQTKAVLNDSVKLQELLREFHGYGWPKGFTESPSMFDNLRHASKNDSLLLGTLVLVANYFEKIGMRWDKEKIEYDSAMGMLCSQKTNCNISSTRVLDMLVQVGVPRLDHIEVIKMPGHVTLRVRLDDGSSVYFNDGHMILPKKSFDNEFLQTLSAWQILGSNFFNFGNTIGDRGNLDGQIIEYNKALAFYPKNDRVYKNACDLLADAGDLGAAIDACTMGLLINPNAADLHNDLGVALLKRGDVDDALIHFRRAAQIEPQNELFRKNIESALSQKEIKEHGFFNWLFK